MYLQQGIIDVSFGEIVIDSGVYTSKLFVLQDIQYIIYSTNNELKISKIDGTSTQAIYTGDKLKINDIYISVFINVYISLCGKNINTGQGFLANIDYSNGTFELSNISYHSMEYIKIIDDLAYLIIDSNDTLKLIQQKPESPINGGNPLYITTLGDKIYKDSFYDSVNDDLSICLESFDVSNRLLELEVYNITNILSNITLQSSHIINDVSKNIAYMDMTVINNTPYVIVSSQSTITSTENIAQNTFSFTLQDNTIKVISLIDYSVYRTYTLTNIFIENIKVIEHEPGKYTLIGYGYEDSGLPLKYLSIPLDNSENIDLSVEGKGYHVELSTLGSYYLVPDGKVNASKDSNTKDIYMTTEAVTESDVSGVSLISVRLNYPTSLQEILPTAVDGNVIRIVDEYGRENSVIVKKPNSGQIIIDTIPVIDKIIYPEVPPDMVILYSDISDSYISVGETQVCSLYIKYFHTSGLMYDFNTNPSLYATLKALSPSYPSLNWYSKDLSSGTYELIDSSIAQNDGITFYFEINKNSQVSINGPSNTNEGNGSGGTGGTGGTGGGSIGSDPHITTLFGVKYDMKKPSSRLWYNIFKKDNLKIEGHFTGLKHGIFFDTVKIKNKDELLTIDFNKRNIKNKSSYVIEDKVILEDLRYKNLTGIKNYGKTFEPSLMTKINITDKKTPFNIYVDFNTRYLHFRFPCGMPNEVECSGLLVRKEN